MLVEPPPSKMPAFGRDGALFADDTGSEALANLIALRGALKGSSVVDSSRLWFADRAGVDQFLRLNEFDTDNPLDLERLRELHREATLYLAETHRYRLPKRLEQPDEIHDLFLWASHGTRRLQRFACMTLKVMHILHHLNGRELLFNMPVSEAQLFGRLNAKVFTVIDRMRLRGISVQEFTTGKKSRTSLVTKLLAKRGTVAAHVFDKLRFRIVLSSRDDLVRGLVYLARHLVPFNYVIPEQSQNGIIGLDDLVRVLGLPTQVVQRYWHEEGQQVGTPVNEFSGSTYRCVNFVADIPLRIDDIAPQAAPAVVFAQAEIQLLDADTARQNDLGDNAHPLYKKRQRARVRRRIEGPAGGAEPAERFDDPD